MIYHSELKKAFFSLFKTYVFVRSLSLTLRNDGNYEECYEDLRHNLLVPKLQFYEIIPNPSFATKFRTHVNNIAVTATS